MHLVFGCAAAKWLFTVKRIRLMVSAVSTMNSTNVKRVAVKNMKVKCVENFFF